MRITHRQLLEASPLSDVPKHGEIGFLTFPQFVIVWNKLHGLATPALHVTVCRWLYERWLAGDRRLLLMVFRDAGKSTLVALFAAWLLTGMSRSMLK